MQEHARTMVATAFLVLTLAPSAFASRERLTFDYGWRFSLGDPTDAFPKLTTASADPTFTTSVDNYTCSQIAYSALGRMGADDCRGACSATPGCLVWQYFPADTAGVHRPAGFSQRACYIHDGTLGADPQCAPGRSGAIGGRRAAVPPPVQNRTGVTWAKPSFDDSSWDRVDLPHDFVLLGDYADDEGNHGHGYLPRNQSGWYRKEFNLPARYAPTASGGFTWLHFEGVFQAADVWINGVHVKRHTSGYLGFDVDLNGPSAAGLASTASFPKLAYGGGAPNVIVVRADASFGSGHWYEGGGIQRKVWLYHVGGGARFVTDGLFAQTAASSVTAKLAVVVPTAEVQGAGTGVSVRYFLVDPTGSVVANSNAAEVIQEVEAGAGASSNTAVGDVHSRVPSPIVSVTGGNLTINNPRLWSIKAPALYTLVAELIDAGAVIDTLNTTIGLRSIDWDSASGFELNGQRVHIRGFSHHSDFGGIGAAVPDRINVFRANALRSLGGNTWRTSHNPYRPAVYDILDAVGVLVWDENRDFNQLNTMDMERLVRRDRNHPAVVIWSACNEVECFVSGNANVTGTQMRAATKRWDTTRPFSANLNQVKDPHLNDTLTYLGSQVDVLGFSHSSIATVGAAELHSAWGSKAIISSECCSCRTQRGEDFINQTAGLYYAHTLDQAQCMARCLSYSYSCYPGSPGTCASPKMGTVAGTLGVWTLFDYGGEPGPWPSVSSSFGQFDIAGFPKSSSYWYRANWLDAVPDADAGKPPVLSSHTVRISQSWTAAPAAPEPFPMNHSGTVPCNYTLMQALCPVHPYPVTSDDTQACEACLKVPKTRSAVCAAGCVGYNLWPNYCRGLGPSFPDPPAGSMDVQVFSDAPEVELFLNDKSLGKQQNELGNFTHFAGVNYAPGNLTAVGSSPDWPRSEWPVHTVLTAGPPVALVLSLDAPSKLTGTGEALLLDGHDAALVRATVVDAKGLQVGTGSQLISFAVSSGPGRVAGVHNGDAKSHEHQVAASRTAYHGLCRAIVKVTVDMSSPLRSTLAEIDVETGDGINTVAALSASAATDIVVTATSPGLAPGRIVIPTSVNAEQHSPLAVAAASVTMPLKFD